MKKRLIGIQSLRGILIFFIVMHHIINYFGYTTGLGYAGVSLFIIMSGFLEAYNHLNQAQQFGGGGELLKQKIKYFLPLHILTFLMSFLLLCIDQYQKRSESILFIAGKIIFNLTFTQSFIPVRKIYFGLNGVTWYLGVYLYFIFFLPSILKKIKKYSNNQCILTLIVILLFQLIWGIVWGKGGTDFSLWIIYINPFIRIFDFIIGILFCAIVMKGEQEIYIREPKLHRRNHMIEFIVIQVFILTLFFWKNVPLGLGMNIVFVLPNLGIIYIFSRNEGIFTKLLTNKFTSFLGRISMELFLTHQVLLSYIARINNHLFHFHTISLSIIMFGGMILFAYILHRYILYTRKTKLLIEKNF